MSDLLQLLTQQLGGNAVGQMSQQTGLDPATVSNVTAAAVPLLVSALARNASSEQGAASLAGALARDHDGGVLDDVAGFFGSGGAASSAGAGILGHVLGGRQDTVATSLGAATGANSAQVMQILQMLAPIVMGAVGRSARQQSSLNPADLAAMLGQQRGAVEQQMPSGLGGMLTNLLDSNHDGSVIDDLGSMASKFFGSNR
jgi:hypothetical protein